MRFAYLMRWVVMIALAGLSAPVAAMPSGVNLEDSLEITASIARLPEEPARVEILFEQDGEPEDGAVRVILFPMDRALTESEVRNAMEQAFQETLNEPGLPEVLQRIQVDVHLFPVDSVLTGMRSIVYESVAAGAWTVRPAWSGFLGQD